MKKKIFIITVIIIIGLLIGVIVMRDNMSNRADLNTENLNIDESRETDLIKEVRQYQAEDQDYDGKGVFWDGETVSMKDDSMDDKNLTGDRFGVYNTDEIVTDDWSVRAKIKDDIKAYEQDNDHLYYAGEKWKMEVKKVDYNERRQYYSEDKNSLDISEEAVPKNFEDRYEESSIFLNFSEVDGNLLAGYVYLLKDYYGHEYEVSYHGTGFMEDIFLNASCLGGSFNVLFDIDAWAKEHKPSGN